jgi:hypothetical protein
MAYRPARVVLLPLVIALFGCSGTGGGDEFETNGSGNGSGNNGSGAGGNVEGGLNPGGGTGGGSSTSGGCDPSYYDFPDNNFDDDCSGGTDDPLTSCDQAISNLAETDAMMAASAMGLCKRAEGGSWGLLAARYVKADGTPGMDPRSHGLLPNLGVVQPREGGRLLALSSGTARNPTDPEYWPVSGAMMNTQSPTPPGFPGTFTTCNDGVIGMAQAFDPAALEIDIRPPQNASGFAFDLNFYTFEFPEYLCSEYNDYYVTLMDPPATGHLNGNVSFDVNGNPISVNAGFVNVCTPGNHEGRNFPCPQGPGELNGTGFETHAASGWLTTTAPITDLNSDGAFTLRFAIWDAGDMILDSTILIDNFRWIEGDLPDVPVTEPAPH